MQIRLRLYTHHCMVQAISGQKDHERNRFRNVYVVPEQELPDGEFPTVSYPNPESDEAFVLGLELAKKVDADLVLATDLMQTISVSE